MTKRKVMNKKGISAIVATVLIILITVAAVAIVWAAIIPMLRNQLESGTQCFDAVSQILISDAGYTCYDASTGNVSVQVERGAKNFNLVGIDVYVSSAGNTNTYSVTSSLPNVNEGRVYNIDVSSMSGNPDQIQIAPVISVGNSEKTCDVSSTVDLREC